MFNTKLLVVIAFTLASIAGSLAYSNARQARKDAELAEQQAGLKKAQQQNKLNWGGSAKTIKDYRP